jgi:hypothetical protein
MLGSHIFVEEPYDGLTVPKNIKTSSDFDHIKYEFAMGYYLAHPEKEDGTLIKPTLAELLERTNSERVATRKNDIPAEVLQFVHN